MNMMNLPDMSVMTVRQSLSARKAGCGPEKGSLPAIPLNMLK